MSAPNTDFIRQAAIANGMDKSDSCRLGDFVAYLAEFHAKGATEATIVNLIRATAMADIDDDDLTSPAALAFNLIGPLMDQIRSEIATVELLRKVGSRS